MPLKIETIGGKNATIRLFPDKVLKAHEQPYFDLLKKHSLRGEDWFLHQCKSMRFVNKIAGWDGGLWFERCEFALGGGAGFSATAYDKLSEQGVTNSELMCHLNGILSELERYRIRHRDIHPGNLLWNNGILKLSDFTFAATYDDPDLQGVNVAYSQNDAEAIEQIIKDFDRLPELRKMIGNLSGGMPGSNTKPGTSYHRIPFPSFDDVESQHGDVSHLLMMRVVRKAGKGVFDGTKILDLGCANGYFTFRLSKIAHRITAVDADPDVIALSKAAAEYHRIKNVEFVNASIDLDYVKSLPSFDHCLMLNVHQWLHKLHGEETSKQIVRELANHCKQMFFMTAHAESRGKYVVKSLKNLAAVNGLLRSCGWKVSHGWLDKDRNRYLFICKSKRLH